MALTIMDKVLHLYPNIQKVMYWHQNPETGLDWEDPYDGLVWENEEIPKPTKAELEILGHHEIMPAGMREAFLADVEARYQRKFNDIAKPHEIAMHQSRMAIKHLLPEEEVSEAESVLTEVHRVHNDYNKLINKIMSARCEHDLNVIKNSYLY